MEWDQFIFKKAYSLVAWFRKKPIDEQLLQRTVYLENLQSRLTGLSRLLCGFSVTVNTSEDVGGWRGGQFYLPASYNKGMTTEQNLDFYIFRIFYLYGQQRLNHCWTDNNNHNYTESVTKAREHSNEVIEFLTAEFGSFRQLYESVLRTETEFQKQQNSLQELDFSTIYGKWYFMSNEDFTALENLKDTSKRNTVAFDKEKEKYTELKSPNKENAEVLKPNTEEQENYTLTHNFEKIETIEGFSGRWRDFDGSDELEEHADALNEADLRHLVRVDNPVHSIYRTEFVNSLGLIETANSHDANFHLLYNEWNYKNKQYKTGYCAVFPSFPVAKQEGYTEQVIAKNGVSIRQMQKQAERFLTDYFVKKRLEWGDEPDLDAMVEAFADRRCGYTPSENLYASKRKRTKDVSVLVLTDVSLSTDGYTGNRRILDTEKEALIMTAEVWNKLGLSFQLDTFSSRTHNHCYYQTIKAFHHTWDTAKERVGAIESSGYTRIGPAVRHATHILENVKADKKWLLLLTDGKPNDYDRYEGDYGIFDTKKAIAEAEQKSIHVSAIAIDSTAKYYLPQMFGNGGFEILHHPNLLPYALLNNYLKIMK